MYGIVFKAIEGCIIENYGLIFWQNIKNKVGLNTDHFMSNLEYDESLSYKLTQTVADELKISLNQILFMIGEYSMLEIGKKQYGSILKSGGNNLEHFVKNIPNFHSRIMLMYPNIKPPVFNVIELDNKNYELHYYSNRHGFTDYLHGILSGLGKLFNQKIEIKLIQSKEDNFNFDIFHLNLQEYEN